MTLWRINLKPDSKKGIEAAEFCVQQGVVGIGWGIGQDDPKTKEEYWSLAEPHYIKDYKNSWPKAAKAVLYRMSPDDLVWTRNPKGNYFLGRITSDWRHVSTPDFQDADIANVRNCNWVDVGAMDNVPGKVVSSFGPSVTVQPVHDHTSELYSMFLFNQLSKSNTYSLPASQTADILNLLSAEDLEDVVGVYLQVQKGCILFPSTCKKDTQFVEYLLWSPQDQKTVGVQVKSGHLSLDRSDYSDFEGVVYLFAASGQYSGCESPHVTCLDPDAVRQFIFDKREALPRRIQRWVDLAKQIAPNGKDDR